LHRGFRARERPLFEGTGAEEASYKPRAAGGQVAGKAFDEAAHVVDGLLDGDDADGN